MSQLCHAQVHVYLHPMFPSTVPALAYSENNHSYAKIRQPLFATVLLTQLNMTGMSNVQHRQFENLCYPIQSACSKATFADLTTHSQCLCAGRQRLQQRDGHIRPTTRTQTVWTFISACIIASDTVQSCYKRCYAGRMPVPCEPLNRPAQDLGPQRTATGYS